MEPKPIKLYFDYKSPFAYLAKDEAYRLEEDYQVQIEWLPYILDIPEALGLLKEASAADPYDPEPLSYAGTLHRIG